MIWFCWVLWYIHLCTLFIIIIIIMSCRQHGYLRPSLATSPYHSSPPAGLQGYILCPHIVAVCDLIYTYILNIYFLVSLGFMAYQPLYIFQCQVPFYPYILNMISIQILLITFLNEPELFFFCDRLNGSTYFYQIRII